MIPQPEPNLVVALFGIGLIAFVLASALSAFLNFKHNQYVLIGCLIMTVILMSLFLMEITKNPDKISWQDQVIAEIATSSCTGLVENYNAYEKGWIKEKIADEYLIDCVTDKNDLEMMLR